MKFEWDKGKAAANLEKHGVSFDTAARGIDEDSARLDTPDTRFEYGESRAITLAEVARPAASHRPHREKRPHANYFGTKGEPP